MTPPNAPETATTTPGQLLEERVGTAADAAAPAPARRLLRVPLGDAGAAGGEAPSLGTVPLADDAAWSPDAFAGPARWVAEPTAARLWLPNTVNVEADWPALVAGRATPPAAVALDFPAYADGRAYSQARVLRRLGFAGELRATGAAVTADQVHFMHRCGFDALELRADQDVDACLDALRQFPNPYQTSADGAVPARVRRRA